MTDLKPGMRVRVEYETVLESASGTSKGDRVLQPGLASRFLLPSGQAYYASEQRLDVNITPLPDVRTVTVEVTGHALDQRHAESLVKSALHPVPVAGTGVGYEWKVLEK